MHKILNYVALVLRYLIAVFLIFLVILTFCQVFTRTFLNMGISWAEELSRHIFVWGVYLGTALCVRDDGTIKISVLSDYLAKKNLGDISLWIKWLGSIVVFAILAWFGTVFTQMGTGTDSKLLPIQMSTVYVSIPICGALSILFTIDEIIEHYKKKGAAK